MGLTCRSLGMNLRCDLAKVRLAIICSPVKAILTLTADSRAPQDLPSTQPCRSKMKACRVGLRCTSRAPSDFIAEAREFDHLGPLFSLDQSPSIVLLSASRLPLRLTSPGITRLRR